MANYSPAPDDDDYDVLIDGVLNIDETLEHGKANNSDTEPCPPYDARVLWAQLVPQLYTAVSLVGVLDNALAVLILVKYKRLRHVENIYFLNLAVSNLCFLFALPFRAHAATHGGTLGHPLCKMLVALSSVGLHSEAFFSALLTLQSCLLLSHVRDVPSTARRVLCGLGTGVLAWLVAVLVALPELVLIDRSQTESQRYKCFLSRPHFLPATEAWERFLTLKLNTVGLLVPLVALIVCLVGTGKTPRSRPRQRHLFRLVLVVLLVFVLMWGPYNVALFLSAFKDSFSLRDCRSGNTLDRSIQVTRIIAGTHCCVNPLLYLLLDGAFRGGLCRLCHRRGDGPPQPPGTPAQDRPWDDAVTAV